ncbi:hypothetical protein QUF85_06435 [Peribacillus frigoritolerans]|uniref:Uncharacterized protein n=2 Tax=Peribacillus frigoritolerans TaxID=450367 RepID=A0AAJ1QL07_9BACI|nr:hypothetical protein [Peribacillus frigoritolerans]
MKSFVYKFHTMNMHVETDDTVFPAEVSIGISGAEEIEQVNAIHKADAIVFKYRFIS